MWGKSPQVRVLVAAVTPLILFAGLTLVGPGPAEAATTTSGKSLLNNLSVAPETPVGYVRTKFKLWVDADHDSCDTREEVLIAESRLAATTGKKCKVVSGKWLSWYDGKRWTNPLDVDIDHVVPLKEAWDSGAKSWDAAKRQAYANDLGYAWSLDAVTDNVNQSKSDRDPADWLPDQQKCRYAIHWVAIKTRWGLAVDVAEKVELASLLTETCGARRVRIPAQGLPGPSIPVPSISTPPLTPTTIGVTAIPPTSDPVSHAGVHPGAFCADYYEYGHTVAGTLMQCKPSSTDSRFRWRAA